LSDDSKTIPLSRDVPEPEPRERQVAAPDGARACVASAQPQAPLELVGDAGGVAADGGEQVTVCERVV